MYDEHGLAKATSKSSFLPKEQKEESQGVIVGILGLGAHYLCIYWA